MDLSDDRIIGRFKNGNPIFTDGDQGFGSIWWHPANQHGLTDTLANASFIEDDADIGARIDDLRIKKFSQWTVAMHRVAADAFGRWLEEGAEKDYPADEIEGFEAARTFHKLAGDRMLGEEL